MVDIQSIKDNLDTLEEMAATARGLAESAILQYNEKLEECERLRTALEQICSFQCPLCKEICNPTGMWDLANDALRYKKGEK